MATDSISNVLVNIPIYIQALPVAGGTRNRHVLASVRVLEVDGDNVRLESAWNTLESPSTHLETVPAVLIPRRRGVQSWVPRDPFEMPIYIMITRRNRFGTTYHVGVAIQVRDADPGAIDVDIDFMRIRRRNVLRSPVMRIVRGGANAAAVEAAEETYDGDVADAADNAELNE